MQFFVTLKFSCIFAFSPLNGMVDFQIMYFLLLHKFLKFFLFKNLQITTDLKLAFSHFLNKIYNFLHQKVFIEVYIASEIHI